MRKNKLVFSLIRDQSVFMTVIMSLLTFLAILAFGIAISIGTGVARWNTQWDLYATVQVMPGNDSDALDKILDDNKKRIVTMSVVSRADMERMLRPWLSGGGDALQNYLPKMYELRFNKKSDLEYIGEKIGTTARFLPHASALKHSTNAGWQMILIATLVLVLVLASIGVCVSYIARNTAELHKRELEILNQIGAHDKFVARQMQIIVARICVVAGAAGFAAAAFMLMLINASANAARIGLMSMIGLNTFGWILLIALPVLIVFFAIWITKKTTYKILDK